MSFIAGMFAGFVVGFVAAAAVQAQIDENSVRVGYVKMCGKHYKIEELKKGNENENLS